MKKVLFVATVDSHINHFHLPYLKYFKEMGYEVHVATSTDNKIKYCDKKIKLPITRSPYNLSNIKAIRILRGILENEKYDLIHCHTPVGSVVTRIAARKVGTKVIYTAHGFHFYKKAPIVNWCFFYPIEKILARYTDTIITINKEDYEFAQKKFNCKIKKINGIGVQEKFNIKITLLEKEKLRKELNLHNDDFVVIYSAELNKNKNQTMLIKTFEKLEKYYPKIKLLLVGTDSRNGYYQLQAKNLNNIIFLGYRNDIEKIISVSDIAVSTSIREGFGLNLAEAMSLGLPVIATINRGHKEIIEDGKNGLFVKINDVDDLYSKIVKLYEDKDLYNKMKEEAIKTSEKFLIENIIKEMRDIYEESK